MDRVLFGENANAKTQQQHWRQSITTWEKGMNSGVRRPQAAANLSNLNLSRVHSRLQFVNIIRRQTICHLAAIRHCSAIRAEEFGCRRIEPREMHCNHEAQGGIKYTTSYSVKDAEAAAW